MVLSDSDLYPIFDKLVGHTDRRYLNPASIDIRIGRSAIFYESKGGKVNEVPTALSEDSTFTIPPGGNCLVATWETITIPNGYVGAIFLKSSRAREGYNHALAGWIDPGWSGVITLELMNATKYKHLPVFAGLKIAQLVVMTTMTNSFKPYRGKYHGAEEVQGSYHKEVE